MMADIIDPVEEGIRRAQAEAFQAVPAGGGKVVPMRGGSLANVPTGPVCVGLRAFLAETDPPVWLIGGILQSNYLYALTAPTNHGKTAVSLVMAVCVAAGLPFAERPVLQGNVLILCGENQDGFRLRLMATMESLGVSLADIGERIWVLPQSVGLAFVLEQVKTDAAGMGELAMVLVDTSVSFFSGDNENDNQQAYGHARDLRELTMLPGKPAVLVNCHPSASAGKDMSRDSCVPRGGSAFLNEIDTNLTVWAEGENAEFHWMRKKRGPDFSPIQFEYKAIYVEQHGQQVPTVVAEPISEERERAMRNKRKEDEDRMLFALKTNPNGTFAEWAHECGWTVQHGRHEGAPLKVKVGRVLERLKSGQFVARDARHGWHLTAKGKKEAEGIY